MTDSTTVVAALDSLVKHTTVGDVERMFDSVERGLLLAFGLAVSAWIVVRAWAWRMTRRGAR